MTDQRAADSDSTENRADTEEERQRLRLRERLAYSRLRARITEARTEAQRDDTDFAARGNADPIPAGLRAAAGWTGRLIVIGAGIYLLLWLLSQLTIVIVPAVVSLLIAALLTPLVRLLRRTGMPRAIPPLLAFIVGIAFVAGLVTLIVTEFVGNYEVVYNTISQSISQITGWLERGPLHLNATQLNAALNDQLSTLKRNPNDVVNGALSVVSTTGSILSGTLLTLLTTYFFLADGSSLWRWIARLFPVGARWKVYRAGNRAWEVLVAYMNVTLLVAIIVGLATWIACKIAGVPLSLSAGLIAFLFAFIPTLGGLISSIVVILLTLVSTSLTTAVVIAIVMIAIQTIQGNFIYPLLMNRQLKVHPLASLLLVVLGAVLGGIFGALIAVPLVAVINSGWLELLRASRGEAESDEAAELGPDRAEAESDPTLRDPTAAAPVAEPDLTD